MREIRTSGSTRGKADGMQGIRLLSHVRGNPDTEVCRNLIIASPFLLYRFFAVRDQSYQVLNRVPG